MWLSRRCKVMPRSPRSPPALPSPQMPFNLRKSRQNPRMLEIIGKRVGAKKRTKCEPLHGTELRVLLQEQPIENHATVLEQQRIDDLY